MLARAGSRPRRPWLPAAGGAALAALAVSLPFEVKSLHLPLGPLRLTNLELLAGACVLLALAAAAGRGAPAPDGGPAAPGPRLGLPAPAPWLLGAFLAVLVLSAALAPEGKATALRAAGRSAAGIALGGAVAVLARSPGGARLPVALLGLGAAASAAIGLAEVLGGEPFAWLRHVRLEPTRVGPFLRLSGSFDHANQAAMFLEAAVPLLFGAGLHAWGAGRRGRAAAALAGTAVLAEAHTLTYSRAGWAALLLACGLTAGLVRARAAAGRRPHLPWTLLAASLAAGLAAHAALSPVVRLRVRSETEEAWYRATIGLPPAVRAVAGQTVSVPLRLANDGVFLWAPGGALPVAIGARWHWPDGTAAPYEELRWPLDRPVRPGEALGQAVAVRAPDRAGHYQLAFDLVQEGVIWFGVKTGRVHSVPVAVVGAAGDLAGPAPPLTPVQALTHPPRLTLWRVAWEQIQARPWLGAGPDTFRLTYGRHLGWREWDPTLHANSWYVETAVSAGLLGALPFFAWLAWLGRDVVRQLRRPGSSAWRDAVGASLLVYVLHGVLDYFLLFNPTGLLFWVLVGLWARLRD